VAFYNLRLVTDWRNRNLMRSNSWSTSMENIAAACGSSSNRQTASDSHYSPVLRSMAEGGPIMIRTRTGSGSLFFGGRPGGGRRVLRRTALMGNELIVSENTGVLWQL
jgi:hypothetical protein